jgi:hypothetical protein
LYVFSAEVVNLHAFLVAPFLPSNILTMKTVSSTLAPHITYFDSDIEPPSGEFGFVDSFHAEYFTALSLG